MALKQNGCLAGALHPTHQVCCNATCGVCGGRGCSKRPGGPRQCCMPAILRARRSCESPVDVVCILGGALAGNTANGGTQRTGNTLITARVERRHAAPCATAQVARGQRQCLVGWDESNQVCCNASCGTCGGPGCSKRPGGQHQCCMPEILRSGHACRGQEEGACILHRATPEKELSVGQLGAIRAAALQTLRFSLAFTSVEQMVQERGCDAMPTEAMLVRCRELASPISELAPAWVATECGAARQTCEQPGSRTMVEVDRACNGCGFRLEDQNIWHLLTRAFTVWLAMRSFNISNADLHFTRRKDQGNVSRQLWAGLVGGAILRQPPTACATRLRAANMLPRSDTVCSLPDAVNRLSVPNMSPKMSTWHKDPLPVDRLWILGRTPRRCAPTQQRVFSLFVGDLSRRLGASEFPPEGREPCFWLRLRSIDARKESNPDALRQRLARRVRFVHFRPGMSMRHQVEEARRCHTIVGLHGAQMMQVMWAQPGVAVHEIHNLHQTRMFYYRNIAQLRGLEYSAHPICPVGCIARVQDGSTLISPARLERLYTRAACARDIPPQRPWNMSTV